MSMTILELHEITSRMIAEGKGAGSVGVLLDSFPTPQDDNMVMLVGDASGQHLKTEEADGIGGWFLVIEA